MFQSHFVPFNPYSHHNHHVPNPGCPWEGEIPNGLQPGKIIHITGHVPHHSNRFQFDLKTNNGNALHINPRFDQNCIVRNTEQCGSWAKEERSGHLAFHHGSNFDLAIHVEHDKYRVNINGHHAFDFFHRLPYQEVHRLGISGDVQIYDINFSGGAHGGHDLGHLHSPGAAALRQGVHPGSLIQISGTPSHSAGRFVINLQSTGGNEPDNIPFHFSVRWNDPNTPYPVVIRNNRRYGSWGSEERDAPQFPFNKGQRFDLLILIEPHEFKVAVNGQHFVSFHHRNPVEEINHVGVMGDVSIESVKFW